MIGMPARVTVVDREGVPIAYVEGEIDLQNAEAVGEALGGAVAPASPGLIVDLSGVTYLDSAGLHILFDLERRLSRGGRALRLVIPDRAVIRRVLLIAGVGDRIALHPDVDDAVRSLAAGGDRRDLPS